MDENPPEQQDTEQRAEISRRRGRGRFGLWLLLSMALLAAAGGFAVLAVTGRPLYAPQWVVDRVETRINAALQGKGRVSLGGAEMVIGANYVPRVRLTNLRFLDASGNAVISLPEVRVSLAPEPLLHGQVRPVRLLVSGASLYLRRAPDGSMNLAVGGATGGAEAGQAPQITSLSQVLDKIDAIFTVPELASIRRVDATALSLTLDDRRAGRIWHVTDGRATLEQDARQVSIELGFGLADGSEEPARAVLTFVTQKKSPAARIGARVHGVAARDIASQSPALAWLKLLDAPISGDFRASIDRTGQLGAMEGALQIGKGKLIPSDTVRPVSFDNGSLYFTYDPREKKIVFSQASIDSRVLRIHASGHAYLREMQDGLPHAFVSQIKFSKVMVDPEGLFEKPVRFSQGALDLRLRLDPFDVRVGQLALLEGGRRIDASGRLTATDHGLKVALNANLNQISHSDLLALWPMSLVPKTREWLAENVLTGELSNVNVALRVAPRETPEVALGYDFSGADVRVIKTLPPVEGGHGYATINGNTYTMVIDKGRVTPPKGGAVDVAGSVFQVPDITRKPAPAVVHLRTDSTVTAALSLLNEPPFEFLTKAGQPVDLAQGRAKVLAVIRLPLVDKIELPDVTYDVTGTLTGVRSTRIVPDRVLTADRLQVKADNAGMTIWGPGHLGQVAFDGRWHQDFGPEGKGHSRVTGTVRLSQAVVDEFNLGLPKGSVEGQAPGAISIDLDKGKPPAFTLTSALRGLRLSVPEVGWTKPPDTPGRLEVAGTLGKPAHIGKLALSGPGLSAHGSVVLNKDGTLHAVQLDDLKVGDWLDAPVDLIGQGRGKPVAVSIPAGRIDLSHADFGRGATKGEAVPITVKLDTLKVSNTLSLTGFTGSFTTLGGFNGKFGASVNGQADAQVQGTVVPATTAAEARSAVRVTSDDAGAVFKAAHVYDKAVGGTMDLQLVPRAEPGEYNGTLKAGNIRVKGAPTLADLLGAISVVGLLEQLNGDGIVFSDVNGAFRLTPKGIEVTRGSAIGASLGVTMEGLYRFGTNAFDMQGVISPIYMFNAIGSLLTKQGEGLFGFNYTLKGTAAAPKVSVNPLSILTPGMFRNLFRAPVPQLPK